jgi:hypothetical protein
VTESTLVYSARGNVRREIAEVITTAEVRPTWTTGISLTDARALQRFAPAPVAARAVASDAAAKMRGQ